MSKLSLQSAISPDESKVRTLKHDVEVSSETLLKVVDQLTKKYCKDLDNAIDEISDLLKNRDELHIEDINYYISYLPILMYYAGNAVEDLGIEGDTAKVLRQEAFNNAYLEVEEKTVQAKTSAAQQLVISEQLVENAFARAYKKAKNRIEVANTLHSSLKKVLQWKISELEVTGYNRDNGTGFRRREND